MKLSNVFGDII